MVDEESTNGSEDIDLASLSDEDLTAQMHDDLYDGLGEEIGQGTDILLSRGWVPKKVLDDALVAGMKVVGEDFRDGILFVPEVLLAANAMKSVWRSFALSWPRRAPSRSARWSSALSKATFTTSGRTLSR